MKRAQKIEVRLNDREKQALEGAAKSASLSIGEFVRDWIKTLPQYSGDN